MNSQAMIEALGLSDKRNVDAFIQMLIARKPVFLYGPNGKLLPSSMPTQFVKQDEMRRG